MGNLTLANWNQVGKIDQLEVLPDSEINFYSRTKDYAFQWDWEELNVEEGLSILKIKFWADQPLTPKPLQLLWKIPAINLKGIWRSNAVFNKRMHAEWEGTTLVKSRAAVDAPVLCLFGHDDENVHTFACSDATNTVELGAGTHEETGQKYCTLRLFMERLPAIDHYEIQLRLDNRIIPYEENLLEVADWWTGFIQYKPMPVPEAARLPVYSTWYAYHQDLDKAALLIECEIANKMGYEVIIIDDGWQTNDNKRGYAYTGDWKPERFPDMTGFVHEIKHRGMKVVLWFSVPFIGRYSKAYQLFQGKFLHESEEWKAAIVDPRYPEVRAYLISIYTKALQEWHLDGFKLDFIDEFIAYEDTVLTKENGRDYASVNEAVIRLMGDIADALTTIKPDVLIEFRQRYTGPAMRKFGSMFRAFDCPNDAISNRVRTVDLRLLCGNTAIHSDMFRWNYSEAVDLAALQLLNILFSVPQLSVRLAEIPKDHLEMVRHYTQYWLENRSILLQGSFKAKSPLANYPLVFASNGIKIIYSVYESVIFALDESFEEFDLINGKADEQIVFECLEDFGICQIRIFDCQGHLDWESIEAFDEGVHALEVPVAGLITIVKQEGI